MMEAQRRRGRGEKTKRRKGEEGKGRNKEGL